MRWFVLICCLVLCSCSGASLTNKVVDGVINSVESLESNLPSQCKTDGINASLRAIKSQINTITSICDTEKEVLQSKIDKLKVIIIALIGVILFLLKRGLDRFIK